VKIWSLALPCFLAVLLWALSFFLPTFDIVVEGKRSTSYGYDAFLIGLFSILGSPYFGGLRTFAAWLANPLLWIGLLAFVKNRFGRAFILGVMATTLAATLLVGEGDLSLLLIGYSLWLLSMAIFTLAAGVGLLIDFAQKR
jgi:hypothetical protein